MLFETTQNSFYIVCGENCPNIPEVHKAIIEFCKFNGYSYDFIRDDEVVVDGILYEVFCGSSESHQGRYVVECRKM